MSEEQQFCLRWNNFQVNITSQFEALRDDEDFVDVTLACEGKRLKAHKVVLSACSPYFKDLFKSNPCKHPILFMRDVEFHHLQCLVEFMYAGEVNIAQAQLSAFLRTAESLQIRGLTEAPQRHKQVDGFGSGGSQGRSGGGSSRRATSPGGGSRTPSPEEADQEGEEEVLSLSPPGSPPPAKRACRSGDKSAHLDESSSHNRSSQGDHYEDIKNESMEIVEPKVEVPDYCSDGEGRSDTHVNPAVYQGMENSVDMSQSFPGLQGGSMDILPGTSAQNFIGDAAQDSGQELNRIRHGRMVEIHHRGAGYDIKPLNLSGFTVRNGLVTLGEGVVVTEDQLRRVNWGDYRKLTRSLAAILFSPLELATSSVTGQRWSRAGLHDGRPCKPALDRNKVRAILTYVTAKFPEIEVSKIKQVLAYKCKESASSLKVRLGSVS